MVSHRHLLPISPILPPPLAKGITSSIATCLARTLLSYHPSSGEFRFLKTLYSLIGGLHVQRQRVAEDGGLYINSQWEWERLYWHVDEKHCIFWGAAFLSCRYEDMLRYAAKRSMLTDVSSLGYDDCLHYRAGLDCIRRQYSESTEAHHFARKQRDADRTQAHDSIHQTYGLHQRCSNTNIPPASDPFISSSMKCVPFPRYSDCHAENRYFCSMWRSVGFLMSFAVVLEGMTIAAFAILLVGGKQKREQGWGALTILVTLAAAVQAIGMALMVCISLLVDAGSKANALIRPICSRMTNDFSPAGISTRVGQCARFPGAFRPSVQLASLSPLWFYRVKAGMNLYPTTLE